MAAGFPGGTNTHIPLLDISGNLRISHSRNLKRYPVTRVCTVTPVKKKRGSYLYHNPQDNFQVLRRANWPATTNRPTGNGTLRQFEEKTFVTERYSFDGELDTEAVELANWPVLQMHAEELANDAMIARTKRVYDKLFDTAQYAASHTVTATSLAGGFLDGGSSGDPRILRALSSAGLIIQGDTLGRVRPHELSVLMNNTTALKLGRSREIREYVSKQEKAYGQITLEKDSFNGAYGIPDELYRFSTVVEDLYYQAEPFGAADRTGLPVVPDNTLLVFMREGDTMSDGVEGAQSFSSLHVFCYEDLVVETLEDRWNRNTKMAVTDQTAEVVVAPLTIVQITNIFS